MACAPAEGDTDAPPAVEDRASLVAQVEEAVWAFHAADTARDAEGVIGLLWPEYTMLADGNRITYADVVGGSRAFMASLDVFHTHWTDLDITLLGADHAVSSFLFRDSIVSKDGTVTTARGPNTFVWERRNGEWRVLYGDADHYPVEPS